MLNKRKLKKLLIGITGGIGSGKSLACEYLKKLGCSVFYADDIAREMYSTNSALRKKLVQAFGERILESRNRISFAKLREIIFTNEKNQLRVNKIVHPFVISEITSRAARARTNIAVIEAALIFESGFNRYLDYTFLIHSSVKSRIERVRKRGKLTVAQIQSIIKLQMPEKEKMKLADIIINNDSTKTALQKQVECYYGFLKFMMG